MYLYFRILNGEDEEIVTAEDHECASTERKKDRFRSDSDAQCKTFTKSYVPLARVGILGHGHVLSG